MAAVVKAVSCRAELRGTDTDHPNHRPRPAPPVRATSGHRSPRAAGPPEPLEPPVPRAAGAARAGPSLRQRRNAKV
ncbi:hypothetical protein GCM10009759_19360 [Kitasatospora saccharophila]|uniref:Uncharacterized protein n=1 Tax=Kitasatospora saccharophila TaxID=407973 RepID=A0ABN2WIZ9_9ACTN